jgi:hypothetical protein
LFSNLSCNTSWAFGPPATRCRCYPLDGQGGHLPPFKFPDARPARGRIFREIFCFKGRNYRYRRGESEGLGIDTTSGQSFTVAGSFSGTIRFPGTASNPTARLTSVGREDGFVAKYKDNRLRRDLLVQIGGPGSDSATRVVENRSTTYVAGKFRNTITLGGRTLTSQGQSDTYLARINLLGDVDRVVQIASNDSDFFRDLDLEKGSLTQSSKSPRVSFLSIADWAALLMFS